MATNDYNIINIKDELLNKLRANLNQYDPKNRVQEKTKTFTGDNTNSIFLISKSLSYVKSVKINGIEQKFGKDWNIVWRGDNAGCVTFTNIPSSSDNIDVIYGEKSSTGNFIYPDFPRTDLSFKTLPRIGFMITVSSKPAGMCAGNQISFVHEIVLQIKVVGTSTYQVEYLISKIEEYLKSNVKSFYYFKYLEPDALYEFNNYDDNTEQNYAKIINYRIPNKYEIVNQMVI